MPTPAANIALDEALLEWAEAEDAEWEFLRLWESPRPVVVVGRSSRVSQEVDVAACRARGIPVLRRTSGGAAILAGPGCLMYAVVLSYRLRPELKDIGRAHRFVLGRLVQVLQPLFTESGEVRCDGTSDLVFELGAGSKQQGAGSREQGAGSKEQGATQRVPGKEQELPLSAPRKFSGNSMRAKRTHLLYHGTLLYGFDLPLIETYLRVPPRQPDYRAGRAHGDFVVNLPVTRTALVTAVDSAWPSSGEIIDWPRERVDALVAQQFGQDAWNFEFK